MIETLPTPPIASDVEVSTAGLAGFADLQDRIAGRSQIVWGEHCSECAYPKCYETCAFYTPRPDLHCRRFEAGFEPVAVDGNLGLHRIRFRHWGKLEGSGAPMVTPIETAHARFAVDARISGVIAAIPAPYAVKRKLAVLWNQQKTGRSVPHGAVKAEAFVVECWSAEGQDHAFTLTMLNVGENIGRLFQVRFDAGPDYRRLIVPIQDIERLVDLEAPFLIQIEPIGEAAGRDVVFGVCDFVTLKLKAQPAPSDAAPVLTDTRPVKVVVWDLDDTLWSGILAEDGAAGVHLRPEAVAAVKSLDERGVLQSVASKNDHAEAIAALVEFGLADYFLHPHIDWKPKSQAIINIAAALDLSLDSFVLIDDQPFERAEVAVRHPAVRVMTHTDVATMLQHPWFDLPVTPESRKRRAMYQSEAARAEAFQSTEDDYLGFLRQTGIRASVRSLDAADAERVYELSQRTNQLNFRGTKYGRDEVAGMLEPDRARLRLTVRCGDRFGDYGLIGFVDVDLNAGEIMDLFMSCRVQRKRVEHAMFAWIAEKARSRGHVALRVRHRPTERNSASRAMLNDLGFAPDADASEQVWRRDLSLPFEDGDVVALCADVAVAI
jgi:FkbH-like protein